MEDLHPRHQAAVKRAEEAGGKILASYALGGPYDYLVVLERLESLRYLDMLRPGGTVLIGEMRIPPLTVSSGDDVYPEEDVIRQQVGLKTDRLTLIPSLTLAEQAGTARAHNVVVLGALSSLIDEVEVGVWRQVISRRVPQRYVDVNMAGKLHAIGTPGAPYVVTFMDEESMILASLREEVYASDTRNEVRIVLLAADGPANVEIASTRAVVRLRCRRRVHPGLR